MTQFEFGLMFIVPLSILSGLLCVSWASGKNLNLKIWAINGVILGPFALFVLAFKKRKTIDPLSQSNHNSTFMSKLRIVDVAVILIMDVIAISVVAYLVLSQQLEINEFEQKNMIQFVFSFCMVFLSFVVIFSKDKFTNLFFYMILTLYLLNYSSYVLLWEPTNSSSDSVKALVDLILSRLLIIRTVLWPVYTFVKVKLDQRQ
ncbi:hypothetical protein [Photobacterium sanguinicancri]|uniref:hypothetical protein n=1 Tax=Photobacterium sanguinicancri TaxID=875932 RepID=UPI0021C3B3FB|nr:hypothetical protein [Photobacterium sanguinicancri]